MTAYSRASGLVAVIALAALLYGCNPTELPMAPTPFNAGIILYEHANFLGNSAHLTAELFKLMAGVDLLHVPYKGAAPAVNDLLGGQVNIIFADVAAMLSHLKSGKLKALGIGAAKRFEGLPEVPTIAESGVPGFEAGGFLGLVAPAGTPPAVIQALNAAAQKSLALPEVRDRLLGLASPPVGGTPEQLAAHIKREIDKWARVIRAANIKAE